MSFLQREQELLAIIARQPGVRDRVVTCYRCGAQGRPYWALLGRRDRWTNQALPRAWETHNARADGKPVCASCVDRAISGALEAYRAYLATPAGQRQLERELAGEEE